MPKVFMSHNSRDKAIVREIASQLKQHGVECWIDEAEIKIGDSLTEVVGEAIRQKTDYFIVVLSNNSINSQWVKKELQIALAKEIELKKVVVLPILIEQVNLPAFLSDKLYADFTTPEKREKSFSMLLEALGVSTTVPNSQAIPSSIALTEAALGGKVTNKVPPKAQSDHWLMVYFKRTSEPDKDRRRLTRLHGIITSYPGEDRFTIVIEDHKNSYKMEFPNHRTGDCEGLRRDLLSVVGEGNIEVFERPEW